MVLKEAETNRSLVQKIRKQQATFFGHVMRREGLEHFLTTGKLDRKKTKRKNAGQPEVLAGCWKSDGYDVGSSKPRNLERHDRQRHEAKHFMEDLVHVWLHGNCLCTTMAMPQATVLNDRQKYISESKLHEVIAGR